MAPGSLLGTYLWLLPKCTLSRLSGGSSALLSAFVGRQGILQRFGNAGRTAPCHENFVSFTSLATRGDVVLQGDTTVGGDTAVASLSRKNFHWSISETRRELSSSSSERTAVAQAEFVLAEEKPLEVTQKRIRKASSAKKLGLSVSASELVDEDNSEVDENSKDNVKLKVKNARGNFKPGDNSKVDENSIENDNLEVKGAGKIFKPVEGEFRSDPDELAIASLGVSPEVVGALLKRGITHLFPIQRAVLTPAMEGKDVIGRAKTGTGKTLAFGLPIIDNILLGNEAHRSSRQFVRSPRALVLAPTRELAKQVEKEFMETAPSLSTICVYGGVSISGQQRQLQKGVDIAVGTPGRVIDLMDRGSLNLKDVQFLVLDEADQMLAVGFEEDVEKILEELPAERQSMLFSATMPAWVKKLAKKYLKTPLTIDLVGDSDEKLAEGIKLFAVEVFSSAKRTILNDLITVYAKGEKTIVFTQTKREADEVALSLGRIVGCEALHGDISQAQREKTLNAFREGRFSVLVATDVAARGLDIPNVDLVVHYEMPNDSESFVHRSGRTGRAGKAGTAILLYSGDQTRTVKRIEYDAGCKFEKVTPPSLHEVLEASSAQVSERIKKAHPELIETFLPTAEKLLESNGPRALAAALTMLSGFTRPPTSRSLLTFEEGFTTLRIVRTSKSSSGQLASRRAVTATLADFYPPAIAQLGKIRILDEPHVEGAVFDLPDDVAKELLAKVQDGGDIIDVPKVLPRIEEEESRGRDYYGRFSGEDGRKRGGYGKADRRSSSRFGEKSEFGEGRFDNRKRSSRNDSDDDDWNAGSSRRGSRRNENGGRGGRLSGACFICNKPGHRAADCPKGNR